MSKKEKIIFICTGNACRSQIAEGILRSMAGDKFDVFSAGSNPSLVHPMSIKVMKEIGIDISNHTSDNLNEVDWQGADFAITLCGSANETCVSMPWPEIFFCDFRIFNNVPPAQPISKTLEFFFTIFVIILWSTRFSIIKMRLLIKILSKYYKIWELLLKSYHVLYLY